MTMCVGMVVGVSATQADTSLMTVASDAEQNAPQASINFRRFSKKSVRR